MERCSKNAERGELTQRGTETCEALGGSRTVRN